MNIKTNNLFFSQEILFKNKSTPSLSIINIEKQNNKISKLSLSTNNSTTFASK